MQVVMLFVNNDPEDTGEADEKVAPAVPSVSSASSAGELFKKEAA